MEKNLHNIYYKKVITLLLLFFVLISPQAMSQTYKSVLSSDGFGAVGDGKHDDTEAIQKALDQLSTAGGGVLLLERGIYLVSTLKTGTKTSIIGAGIGVTIIRQKPNVNAACLSIPEASGGLELSNFTISGNNRNNGIYIEKAEAGSNEVARTYISNLFTNIQPAKYKWIKVDNVSVFNFDTGINVEPKGFNVNIQNCNIENNGDGIIFRCSDSSISNSYIENNRKNGVVLYGSNNKMLNIKSIFNGIDKASDYAAVRIEGSRCQLTNIETQDNYCKGFHIKGYNNVLTNCISNTDGYTSVPFHYDPSTQSCGFYIEGEKNIFSACMVTTYNNNYDAMYYAPVIIKDGLESDYVDIYSKINVAALDKKVVFHEAQDFVRTAPNKNAITNAKVSSIGNDGRFFTASESSKIKIQSEDAISLEALNILVDFRLSSNENYNNWPRLFSMDDPAGLELVVYPKDGNIVFTLYSGSGFNFPIYIKEDLNNIISKTVRAVLSISTVNGKSTALFKMYACNSKGEWYKFSATKDVSDMTPKLTPSKSVVFGNRASNMMIKRFVITREPINDNLVIPNSDASLLQPKAEVYIDADNSL